MNQLKYDVNRDPSHTIFSFTSIGHKGQFKKAVVYRLIDPDRNIYNLGFGDLKYDSAKNQHFIDDRITNDNGDIRKILATVAWTAYEFTSKFPQAILFFTGSDSRRTDTYKRAIMLNYKELSETFHIFGTRINGNNEMTDEPFDYKKDFDGFLIKRK